MDKVAICPTVTAFDAHDYRAQIEKLARFAGRIHIDLMDGIFAPTKSPGLAQVWWPHEVTADIHLMYQRPMDQLELLIKLKPHLVVIHNEADVHHMEFAARLHAHGIEAGLALLADTPVEFAEQVMHSFDHVLVFSGKLGYHGGQADLAQLEKVKQIYKLHPEAEIGWDGGINSDNARQLVAAGVNVLNVGGYIAKSEAPQEAYAKLKTVIGASIE